jgi:hypothetical protein
MLNFHHYIANPATLFSPTKTNTDQQEWACWAFKDQRGEHGE